MPCLSAFGGEKEKEKIKGGRRVTLSGICSIEYWPRDEEVLNTEGREGSCLNLLGRTLVSVGGCNLRAQDKGWSSFRQNKSLFSAQTS